MKKFLLILCAVLFVGLVTFFLLTMPDPITLGVCVVIGIVAAAISCGVMKGKLRTVRPQHRADSYVRPGSFELTVQSDVYLYSTTRRRAKPKQDDRS